jgi:hypothetical protein
MSRRTIRVFVSMVAVVQLLGGGFVYAQTKPPAPTVTVYKTPT